MFALLVIVGLGLAVYRRFISKAPRLFSNYMDHYGMFILGLIMVSGFLLEATKISSYSKYQSMVEDYASTDDEAELRSLESYWVKEFGVVSPNLEGPFDDSTLAQGLEMHEMDCAFCHSKPQWAPVSYGLSRTLKPFAIGLDKTKAHEALWYIHFLACFVGLAYLPFSKMFHIFTGPLSLLANAVMDEEKSDPANIATRQVMELDACTHCGTCSLQCSVGVCYNEIPNVNILPSEKIGSVKALVAGKKLSEEELRSIQEGLYLCTNCNRCTVVCPVGINLQDLWFNLREAVLQRGYPEILSLTPLSLYRGLRRDAIERDHYRRPLEVVKNALEAKCRTMDMYGDVLDIARSDKELIKELRTSLQSNSYSLCFTCTTCTVACPVVRSFDKPVEALDFVPHQIIHAAMLGLGEPIFRSRMLWSCLGCYQCQESCPQGVRVTDVFYKLKNMTIKQLNGKTSKS
jgi:heterodisulfide reductase subunit C